MKKMMLIVLFAVFAVSLSAAQLVGVPQTTNATTDILGAHLLYGRGCIGCHAPHSGAGGNGFATTDTTSGNWALWGEDLGPLYNQPLAFGDGGSFAVTLPSANTYKAHDPLTDIMFCLSCHDGNLAKGGHMKNATVETLPVFGGKAPTLLGNDGTGAGNYANDHPVGPNASIGCGGTYDWDCTISGGKIVMNGANSSVFAGTNYIFAVRPVNFASAPTVPAVGCTTCHDQHSQNIYAAKLTNTSGTPTGYYQTMFFLRGYYNPNTGGNNAAQFCRQCHGGEANEMKGQLNVPTT